MYFITFEGPEGSGKTTQINKLAVYLKKKGLKYIITREPGGSFVADKIRNILLDTGNKDLSPDAELLLYLASRAQHVKDKILPALKQGKIVICDRFSDSTMAYQGFARGFKRSLIRELNNFATGGLEPDLTLLFDIDVKKGLSRAHKAKNRKDRLELESLRFHNAVRKGFLKIAEEEPGRVKVIKVTADIDAIHRQAAGHILKLLTCGKKNAF